jgi:hypothetical protein
MGLMGYVFSLTCRDAHLKTKFNFQLHHHHPSDQKPAAGGQWNVQSAGLEATSNNCQKTLLSRFDPANNPSKKRPTMNMSESSIKLLAMTMASNIEPY